MASPSTASTIFSSAATLPATSKESGSDLLPTWKLFLDHPAYDSVWSSRAVENTSTPSPCPRSPSAATTTRKICTARRKSTQRSSRMTPSMRTSSCWVRGVTAPGRSPQRHLGNLDYGEPIGTEFRTRIEARFFAHYLKDEPGFTLEDTASFQTGSNTWQYYSHFPPKESRPTSLYLAGAGLLSWNSSTTSATASYVSDPANPSSLSSPPHPAHVLRRLAMVQLAHGRPALRHQPQRRRRLQAARAHAEPHRHRRSCRRYLRSHHRQRQRSRRQAHRPISGGRSKPDNARLSASSPTPKSFAAVICQATTTPPHSPPAPSMSTSSAFTM